MSDDESEIFRLNAHCIEIIFDLLSLDDLCAMSKTCTHIQALTVDYFKWKYRNYSFVITFPCTLVDSSQKGRRPKHIKSCLISTINAKVMECFGDHVQRWHLAVYPRRPNMKPRWLLERLPYAFYFSPSQLLFPFKGVDFARFKRTLTDRRTIYRFWQPL